MEETHYLIPKVFYTSVPNLNKVHPSLTRNWDFLKTNNPGWKHVTFDADSRWEYIKVVYGKEILRTYERIHPTYGAARADYFRYLLMYEKGGVWLDAKSSIQKNLQDILKPTDEFLLSQWGDDQTSEANELFWGPRSKIPTGEFISWCIVAKPKHRFLQQVIEDITQNINSYHPFLHGIGGMGVLGTTGPLAYTRSIFPILDQATWRAVNLEEEGMQYTIFGEIFQHRSIVGSNYRSNIRPLVDRGFAINSQVIFTILRLYTKKLIRRVQILKLKLT